MFDIDYSLVIYVQHAEPENRVQWQIGCNTITASTPTELCAAKLCVTKFPSAQLRKVEALGLLFLDDACFCPSTRSTVHNAQCGTTLFVCKLHFFQRIIFSGTLWMRV